MLPKLIDAPDMPTVKLLFLMFILDISIHCLTGYKQMYKEMVPSLAEIFQRELCK